MQRDMTHCIKLVMRLTCSDYIWYVLLYSRSTTKAKQTNKIYNFCSYLFSQIKITKNFSSKHIIVYLMYTQNMRVSSRFTYFVLCLTACSNSFFISLPSSLPCRGRRSREPTFFSWGTLKVWLGFLPAIRINKHNKIHLCLQQKL